MLQPQPRLTYSWLSAIAKLKIRITSLTPKYERSCHKLKCTKASRIGSLLKWQSSLSLLSCLTRTRPTHGKHSLKGLEYVFATMLAKSLWLHGNQPLWRLALTRAQSHGKTQDGMSWVQISALIKDFSYEISYCTVYKYNHLVVDLVHNMNVRRIMNCKSYVCMRQKYTKFETHHWHNFIHQSK